MTHSVPYINIHTHHLPKFGEVGIVNNRLGVDHEIDSSSLFSVGIHPWDASPDADMNELEQWIKQPQCFAIGECGLDKLKGPALEIQKTCFKAQLQLALLHQKPVIIHCVKAFDEVMQLCEPYYGKLTLIIHGFNKSAALARQLLAKGFYLSLGMPPLTKEGFDMKVIPLKKLFLETDTLDNTSIEEVYQTAASKLNIELDVLKEKIYGNFVEIESLTQ